MRGDLSYHQLTGKWRASARVTSLRRGGGANECELGSAAVGARSRHVASSAFLARLGSTLTTVIYADVRRIYEASSTQHPHPRAAGFMTALAIQS